MYKVCIIRPGSIASNPRLVKEAEALSENGYKVHLIYTRHLDYLIERDEELLLNHPEWTSDYIDWASTNFRSKAIKMTSGIIKRSANFILKHNLYSPQTAPFLINRFYKWQLNKALLNKADLYIAHYPDSIAIASRAAKINNALFSYDAEDYHRGEDVPRELIKAITIIEDSFLNEASYISAASPLISKAYEELYPSKKIITIENMFPLKRQPTFIQLKGQPYKFFWFSQTIGPKRGLEEFFLIVRHMKNCRIQLTLVGNYSDAYKYYLQNKWLEFGIEPRLLTILSTVEEKRLFDLASTHHFGLCLEIPYTLNRDLCLTNKIYTYMLSGNFLILSKTKAQNSFYTTLPQTAISIDLQKPKEAAAQIETLMENLTVLNEKRKQNHTLGQSTINFDQEKKKLLEKIANLWK